MGRQRAAWTWSSSWFGSERPGGAGAAGRGHGAGGAFVQPEALVPAAQRGGRPPVGGAGHGHQRGHERGPDQERVNEHGDAQPDAQHLDGDHSRGGEGPEHHGQQPRSRGDHPPGMPEALGDRSDGVAAAVEALLDPGEQEHLVVHRQSEGDAEHQDRRVDVDPPRGRDAEQRAEMAILEDQYQDAERCGQAQQVEHQRLDGDEQAAGQQERQQQGGERDQAHRPGQPRPDH